MVHWCTYVLSDRLLFHFSFYFIFFATYTSEIRITKVMEKEKGFPKTRIEYSFSGYQISRWYLSVIRIKFIYIIFILSPFCLEFACTRTHWWVAIMLTHLESMFREIMPLAHILFFSLLFTSYNPHIYNAINLSAYINRNVYFSCYIFFVYFIPFLMRVHENKNTYTRKGKNEG